MADNMWLFVPLQQKLKEFLVSVPQYPFQEGMNMSAGDVNYNTLTEPMAGFAPVAFAARRATHYQPNDGRTTRLAWIAPVRRAIRSYCCKQAHFRFDLETGTNPDYKPTGVIT